MHNFSISGSVVEIKTNLCWKPIIFLHPDFCKRLRYTVNDKVYFLASLKHLYIIWYVSIMFQLIHLFIIKFPRQWFAHILYLECNPIASYLLSHSTNGSICFYRNHIRVCPFWTRLNAQNSGATTLSSEKTFST